MKHYFILLFLNFVSFVGLKAQLVEPSIYGYKETAYLQQNKLKAPFTGVYRIKNKRIDSSDYMISGEQVEYVSVTYGVPFEPDKVNGHWRFVPAPGGYYTIRPINNMNLAFTLGDILFAHYLKPSYCTPVNNSSPSQLWRIIEKEDGSLRFLCKRDSLVLAYGMGAYKDEFEKGSLEEGFNSKSNWYLERSKLYLTGDATPAGWRINNLISLEERKDSMGIFTWTGLLNPGTFKFQLTRDQSWLPSVNASSANELIAGKNKLVINESYNNDHKFKVISKGIYTINIDINKLEMRVIREDLGLVDDIVEANYCLASYYYETLAFNGSDPNNVYYGRNDDKYRDWRIIKVGDSYAIRPISMMNKAITVQGNELIISDYTGSKNQLWDIFRRSRHDDNSVFCSIMSKSNNKFISYDFDFHRTKRARLSEFFESSIFAIKFSKLYLTGDATPAGWDINKLISLSMPEDDLFNLGIFSWTGVLKPGSFKFQLTRNQSWLPIVSALTYMEPIKEENDLEINTNYKSGYRFVISEKDTYTIKVDMNRMKMKISRPLSPTTRSIEIGDISRDNKFTAVATNHSVEIRTTNTMDFVRLFNLKGTLIDSVKDAEGKFYLGNNLPSGVYIVEFVNGATKEQRKVMIK